MKLNSMVAALGLVVMFASCKKAEDPSTTTTNDTIKAPVDTTMVPVIPDSLTEDNLLMGNPSNAAMQITLSDNYLVVKPAYTLSYNSIKGSPNWVSWHLSTAWQGSEPRCDCFNTDYSLPTSFYRAASYDYTATGFDRGHMCPSEDRDLNYADNSSTFLMSNIIPQSPKVNQQPWNALENYCTTLMNQGNELYIISGGYGSGGIDSVGSTPTYTIANGNITVPSNCWKIIVIIPAGKDDVSRISSATRVIAVDMPNTASITNQWGLYRVSVDALETATGYNFLTSLSTSLQNSLESTVDNGPTQ